MLCKIQPKTEQEWKECRKLGIGSSDVGTILGQNKYENFHKWWEYRTGILEEKEQTDAMVRGHLGEDFVAKFFAHKTDSEIIESSAADIIYYDDKYPWRRATPDRFCWIPGSPRNGRSNKNKFILECKTISKIIVDGNYPKYWRTQVMYQLGICGCAYGYIAWIDPTFVVDFERIDFDEKEFNDICTAVDSVWKYNIQMRIEPSLSTFEDVTGKFKKEDEGKTIELSNDMANKVEELKRIKEEQKDLEAREKAIKTEIAITMEDAEIAVDAAGVQLCTFKAARKFDPKEVEKQNLELYHRYMVHQPDEFDSAAFKSEQGNKEYKKYCTAVGARVLKIK